MTYQAPKAALPRTFEEWLYLDQTEFYADDLNKREIELARAAYVAASTPPAPAEPQEVTEATLQALATSCAKKRGPADTLWQFDDLGLSIFISKIRGLAAPPPQQPAQEGEAALHAEWMACETRRPWVVNSLQHRAEEMRAAEKRCRNAYRKDFMGKPAAYVADAFAEAATAFESRLSAMSAAQGDAAQGGGN